MCGIVGAVSTRNIVPILIEGLKRLEYRGYDSCGVAVHQGGELKRARSTARVAQLEASAAEARLDAGTGIAHTRWATHGAPEVHNAHPHFSRNRIALVHNGIIENHDELRDELKKRGYEFSSQTDTEVIAHLVDHLYDGDLFDAVQRAVLRLKGAYAIAVFCRDEPQRVVGAREGSPLILGIGQGENFLASDAMALAGVTDQIVYLEEGDVVDLQLGKTWIAARQADGRYKDVQREVRTVRRAQRRGRTRPVPALHAEGDLRAAARHRRHAGRPGRDHRHQPRAVRRRRLQGLQGRAAGADPGLRHQLLQRARSPSTGWKSIAGIPTQVEIASEYRYRDSVPNPKTLVVTISQSGETADTLAALKHARGLGMEHTLTICNVATSAMVRECKFAYITRAGVEVGVASTKAFTTQLVGLFLLTLALAQVRGRLSDAQEHEHLKALRHLPVAVQAVLALEPQIIAWAEDFARKENALFLGRGLHYPIALEGALKLKEISYIHAEAYPAGELKHGPLALVTGAMPVVTVAPNDALVDKLKSNLQEVRARGGELFVMADEGTRIDSGPGVRVIRMPEHYGVLSPILHVVPLQLLAYHTACARGTDVDKPRNLAKSVTVE